MLRRPLTILTTAFARVGFSGDYGGTYFMTRLVGSAKARELYFLSERVSAEEALRLGLIHEVTTQEALQARVSALCQALLQASPHAMQQCKQLLRDVAGRDIDDALVAQTVQGIADIRASEQGKEGVQSFLQKRKPSWQE